MIYYNPLFQLKSNNCLFRQEVRIPRLNSIRREISENEIPYKFSPLKISNVSKKRFYLVVQYKKTLNPIMQIIAWNSAKTRIIFEIVRKYFAPAME